MSESYEYYAAQVGHLTEAEVDQANFEVDMAREPVPFLTDEELAEMERDHLAWEAEMAS